MNNETTLLIPYVAFEGAISAQERSCKRLLISLIVAIICLLLSNLAWLYAWNQYDYVDNESNIELQTERGITNFIGNDGDIANGIEDQSD